jgi:hypothetical protein
MIKERGKRTMKPAMAVMVMVLAAAAVIAADEVKTSQTGPVNGPPVAMWSLLKDVGRWADWCSAVEKAELVKGDGVTVGSEVKFWPIIADKKTPTPIKLVVSKSEPNRLLEYRARSAGMEIVFGFRLEEKVLGSEFTSYENISGPGAKMFLKLYGQQGLDQEHRAWVEGAAKRFGSEK